MKGPRSFIHGRRISLTTSNQPDAVVVPDRWRVTRPVGIEHTNRVGGPHWALSRRCMTSARASSSIMSRRYFSSTPADQRAAVIIPSQLTALRKKERLRELYRLEPADADHADKLA